MMGFEMNLINKVKYRFSIQTFDKLAYYMKLKKLDSDLRKHINDYYKPFLYSLFFGRLYSYVTLYGLRLRHNQNNYLKACNSSLDLTMLYKSKNHQKTLGIINESNNALDEFEIYGLKFSLRDVLACQQIFLWELKDLVIPYLCKNHLLFNQSLLGEGTYETENVFVNEGDIVFDIGANMGIFTLFSVLKRSAGKVYAFEPVKSTYNLLEKNLSLNGVQDQTSLINKGLGDLETDLEMSISRDNIGANSMVFDRGTNEIETVSITTLDSFIESNSIKQIDFIKVDIEGAERLFLEGAQRTLAKFRPKLSICTYHLIDDPIILTELILQANPNYKIEYYSKKLFAW